MFGNSRMTYAKSALDGRYALICSRTIDDGAAEAWLSEELTDSAWDDFLRSTSLGHFEQSSLWAQAKICEGWRPARIVLTQNGQITGGVQLLVRDTVLGPVGFINRGPVAISEKPVLLDLLSELITTTAESTGLRLVLIRPPDESLEANAALARHRFLPDYTSRLDGAALVLDLAGGFDGVKRRMRKTTREAVRQSERRGITIREGDEHDLGTFFSLLVATCKRRNQKPRPATEADLREVWRAFHPGGCVRLSLAEYEGQIVSGSFCVCFGERVTGWRKVWSGEHRERHPNQALIFEAIEWAHGRGYKIFELGGVEREIADAVLSGKPLSESQKAGKDFVHLGFGGVPRLLPEPRLHFPNPLAQFVYQAIAHRPWFSTLARRFEH